MLVLFIILLSSSCIDTSSMASSGDSSSAACQPRRRKELRSVSNSAQAQGPPFLSLRGSLAERGPEHCRERSDGLSPAGEAHRPVASCEVYLGAVREPPQALSSPGSPAGPPQRGPPMAPEPRTFSPSVTSSAWSSGLRFPFRRRGCKRESSNRAGCSKMKVTEGRWERHFTRKSILLEGSEYPEEDQSWHHFTEGVSRCPNSV